MRSGTLIRAAISSSDRDFFQCVLILAFIPTVHRTYREICVYFPALLPEDIAQQVLTTFLEVTRSPAVVSQSALHAIALDELLVARIRAQRGEIRARIESGEIAIPGVEGFLERGQSFLLVLPGFEREPDETFSSLNGKAGATLILPRSDTRFQDLLRHVGLPP